MACGLALALVRDARADEPIQVASDDAIDGPAAIEVEVRGALPPRSEGEPTVATTTLRGAELRAPGRSIADVLARAPGTTVARTGGAAELATVGLRGATSAQTPVYFAGVRLNDDVTGTADLGSIPAFLLDRAEVHRGHAPLGLDRPGLGGAVLLAPAFPSATEVRAGATVGSFGTEAALAGLGLGDERAAATIAVRSERTRGDFHYVDDRGTRFVASDDVVRTRENADATTLDVWSAGRAKLGSRLRMTALAGAFAREQGVVGLAVVPARHARARTERGLAALNARVACGESPTLDTCALDADVAAKVTSYLLDDPRRELPFATTRQAVDGALGTARAALTLRPLDALTIEGGAGQSFERISVDPRGPRELRASRASSRVFAGATVRPDPSVDLRAVGELAHEATRSSGASPTFMAPTGRIGAAVRPLDAESPVALTAFGNASYAARVPTLGEQFGVSAAVQGNPDLGLERGPAGELGARVDLGRNALALSFEATGFARFPRDLIAYKRSAAGVLRPFNVGEARVVGAEGELAAVLFDCTRAGIAATVLDARDLADDRAEGRDRLPFLAPWTLAPSLELTLRDLAPSIRLDRATMGARFLHRAARTADPSGLIELPAQSLLELDASVGLAEERLVVRARASNLLDDRTTDLVGYPLPGRAAYLDVEARLP